MRIVIDTNVLLSGVLFGGNPRRLLFAMLEGSVKVFVSPEIIDEYRRVYEGLKRKYGRDVDVWFNQLLSVMRLRVGNSCVEVCRDPDDNKFIECAVDNRCVYIVSGDKDLLVLERYGNVEILTVSRFLEHLDGD